MLLPTSRKTTHKHSKLKFSKDNYNGLSILKSSTAILGQSALSST